MTDARDETAGGIHKMTMTKPDGRTLLLYGRSPIQAGPAPSPADGGAQTHHSHFRWHPLRGEWVVYAGHRQHRTFLPPSGFDPFAPTTDPQYPTELPSGVYDVAVFENRFPSLAPDVDPPPSAIVPTRHGAGASEMIVYGQGWTALGDLPVDHLDVVLQALADRYRELGSQDAIEYVMPFENRGVEVGMTLPHPHGQIYAYPFVPPIPAAELEHQAAYYREHGRSLLQHHVDEELRDGRRLLYSGEHAVAFVPAFARYAYEMWIVPRRPVPSLGELSAAERRDFAVALKTALMKLDGLWSRPLPYVLVYHQAPTDGRPHPESHLHAECYPAHRSPDRLKILAGCELGAGLFTADTLPEEKAAELQAVQVKIDD
jgi:UDPglucose--hexose-1-phosphate uridylyltransferase